MWWCHMETTRIIYKNCLKEVIVRDERKNVNVVLIHQKWSTNLTNYEPVSFLPVRSKIFERLICNSMYKHVSNNNLLSHNQFDSTTGDSYINKLCQLLTTFFLLFRNDTSLFLTVTDAALSNSHLCDNWAGLMIGLTIEKWVLILTEQNPSIHEVVLSQNNNVHCLPIKIRFSWWYVLNFIWSS